MAIRARQPDLNVLDAHEQRRESVDVVSRRIVADLHAPRPAIFWSDLVGSALVGWTAFVVAVIVGPTSWTGAAAIVIAGFALYRGLSFTHEITHLRRRAVPGFETTWNVVLGVPLLLPTFTYVGVHQSHHNVSTYGTKDDPEYLPFASSRKMIFVFAFQSSLLLPIVLVLRFLVLAPIGLVWPRFHRWLETYASSFSMNPHYRRVLSPAAARSMRLWELAVVLLYAVAVALVVRGVLPTRILIVWYLVMAFVSFFNTLRVLGAHDYETDGAPRDRYEQLGDSIDTPGGIWTELWAPVGLRYHAMHHFYPGIPYHNLGIAYRRLIAALPAGSLYEESTSQSLPTSLSELYRKAKTANERLLDRSR